MSEADDERLVVRFDPPVLAHVGRTAVGVGLLLACAIPSLVSSPLPLYWKVVSIGACLVVTPLIGTLLWALWGWRRRGVAMVVASEGIEVGFSYRRPFLVPWREIEAVRLDGVPVRLEVILHDEARAWAYVGAWQGVLATLTRVPPIAIGLALLDQPWEEIEAAAAVLRARGEDGPDDIPSDLRAEAEAAIVALRRRLTHDGDLVTLEDYRRVFRRAPLGSWSDSVGTVSPADSSMGFCLDGTGWAAHGAAQMFGHATDLEWREGAEDHSIDIRLADSEARWRTFDYDFFEEDGRVAIGLEERIPEEPDKDEAPPYDEDGWSEAFSFPMRYGGPCRRDG